MGSGTVVVELGVDADDVFAELAPAARSDSSEEELHAAAVSPSPPRSSERREIVTTRG